MAPRNSFASTLLDSTHCRKGFFGIISFFPVTSSNLAETGGPNDRTVKLAVPHGFRVHLDSRGAFKPPGTCWTALTVNKYQVKPYGSATINNIHQ